MIDLILTMEDSRCGRGAEEQRLPMRFPRI
jgi:hypothetical protein